MIIGQDGKKLNKPIYPLRIEVCGGIASGKTTFTNLMRGIDLETILEDFQTNPFWQSWYADPAKYTFETEVSFMLQHYHQIKKDQVNGKISICDYSFFLDIAYAEMGLKGSQLKTFHMVYEEIKKELPRPALLVHLECAAEVELERIRRRGRKVEQSMNIEFLNKLNKSVEYQVACAQKKIKVISIDSSQKDFANDEPIKKELTSLIANLLVKI